MIDWDTELKLRGFIRLESSTRTYGNGQITGSIVRENASGKIRLTTDGDYDKATDIFTPFSSTNYQTTRIRTTEELDQYIKI